MISLFIRSYPPDFEWLRHSIHSMRKNLTGVDEKVLVVPDTCTEIPKYLYSFFDTVHRVRETHPGYIQQQLDKIRAYKYCKYDHILFSDSDCIYYQPFGARCRIVNDKIILPKTLYTSLPEAAQAWKEVVYMSTGLTSQYEYMRCLPMLHHAEVLRYLDNDEHFNAYLTIVKDNQLSEFNAVGTVAEVKFQHLYTFIDTENTNQPIPTARQYWSWGGITPDILSEIERL